MAIIRMVSTARNLTIIAFTLILLPSTAYASQLGDKRTQLQDINAQIEATESKLSDATKRQQKTLLIVQTTNQKMIRLQVQLNNLQTELNDTIGRRKDAYSKLKNAKKRLAKMRTSLVSSRDKLAVKRTIFNKRLVSAYKSDKLNVVAILLSSEDLNDFIKRVMFIKAVTEADAGIIRDMRQLTAATAGEIAQVKPVRKAMGKQYLHLVAEENRIRAKKDSIVAKQNQLQDEINRQQRLYAQTQQEKDQLARTESLLRARSNKVAKQIEILEEKGDGALGGGVRAAGIPTDLATLAADMAGKYKIPTKLFFALIQQESGWDYQAQSDAGAMGLTQIMPFNVVAMGYALEEFSNSPSDQLEAGAKYLSMQYETFDRWDLALAAYNAGPGAVLKYEGIPPYAETRKYVRSILAMAGMTD